MLTFYYKQIDRLSGEVVGFVSYNEIRPINENDKIFLEEMTKEEFEDEIASLMEDEAALNEDGDDEYVTAAKILLGEEG